MTTNQFLVLLCVRACVLNTSNAIFCSLEHVKPHMMTIWAQLGFSCTRKLEALVKRHVTVYVSFKMMEAGL